MNSKIKSVYDEIHAPEVLLGKVMEMKKEEFKGRMLVKYVAAAVLALIITVVASNGICYAATGETWISKIKILVNGEEREQDIIWYQEGDVFYGTIEIEAEEGEPMEVTVSSETGLEENIEEIVIIAVDSKENEDDAESNAEQESEEE